MQLTTAIYHEQDHKYDVEKGIYINLISIFYYEVKTQKNKTSHQRILNYLPYVATTKTLTSLWQHLLLTFFHLLIRNFCQASRNQAAQMNRHTCIQKHLKYNRQGSQKSWEVYESEKEKRRPKWCDIGLFYIHRKELILKFE